ncbi:MAG: SDR family NAD(P)-dependent oxidoreductase [Defluviicoccus sp.]|nr:SDR family NAD(P)-dependent oxidoreductase [Defluviicoccus sp.]MDG4592759.1 SDR family NAD(P)-dependent oxidoreductase [Defluviicoccus sp.]MDS4010368.1 SDR family NAD(P)-dependent oxidoreductase [Defluviicoccus sp.]MDS4073074.1 SDR family NAD(P)-dependent oxidoreductase [Defluviicoccus sp.]
MDVKGQAAIVTGGGSGLGEATARALAAAGAKVAVFDMAEEAASRVAKDVGGVACICDVSNGESTEAAIGKAKAAHGAARVVVQCAGIAPPAKIVGRKGPHTLEMYSKVVNVNLVGIFNVMRLAAVDMLSLDPLDTGERGVFVNTASIAAFEGQVGQAAYASSKAGVVGLTLPAAREFAPSGVRVLCIAPGIFKTPMMAGLPEETQRSLGAAVPFPSRLGDPAEYAKLIMSIVGNPYLNGEVIRIDGALRMQG